LLQVAGFVAQNDLQLQPRAMGMEPFMELGMEPFMEL
jgi:hypothetical protein